MSYGNVEPPLLATVISDFQSLCHKELHLTYYSCPRSSLNTGHLFRNVEKLVGAYVTLCNIELELKPLTALVYITSKELS